MVRVAVCSFEEGKQGGIVGVDCRYYGEVVLVFVEVCGCCSDGIIERVLEAGVVGTEGEFGDLVGEVEYCNNYRG